MWSLRLLLIGSLVALSCFVATVNSAMCLPRILHGRLGNSFSSDSKYQKDGLESRVMKYATITQKLDHFDGANNVTWQQRYTFDFTHRKAHSNVSFLIIGGEGSISERELARNVKVHAYQALPFDAAIYKLEHRFYGKSHPTPDSSLESLKFLSSRQALADVAEFIEQINEREGKTNWVVFGGSYSGNLALWFREKYPDLAVGAFGSSAPVQAQLNSPGFLQVIENDIREIDKNTDPSTKKKCVKEVRKAFEKVAELLQTCEGKEKLSALFNITPALSTYDPNDENTISHFYMNLLDSFACSGQIFGYDIMLHLCQLFTAVESDPLTALSKTVIETEKGDVGYANYIAPYSKSNWTNTTDTTDMDARSWLYLTCTEFGYYQTTDESTIFGSRLPLKLYLSICKDLFNITEDHIKASVEATNAYYGGNDNYTGTNVMTTYGTFDPWSFSHLAEKQDPSVVVFGIKDGTHCSDMRNCELLSCSDDVKQAQALLIENIKKWLHQSTNHYEYTAQSPLLHYLWSLLRRLFAF